MADATRLRKRVCFHLPDARRRLERLKTQLRFRKDDTVVRAAMKFLLYALLLRSTDAILYVFNAEQGNVDAVDVVFGKRLRQEPDETHKGLTVEFNWKSTHGFEQTQEYMRAMYPDASDSDMLAGAIELLEFIIDRCGQKKSIIMVRYRNGESSRIDYEEFLQIVGA